MKKFTTKTLLALACVAVASVQIASAGTQVLSGADITGYQGGLSKIEGAGTNKASLHFNADTKVNWGHLNVAADEQLHFLNGNHAILNVVEKGASKFAGQVTSQTGKVIISNPNGIVFTGGSAKGVFAGDIVLTTKDLASVAADQIANLSEADIKAVANGTQFGVIALKDGASITSGGDITIVANGVSTWNADLIADNGNVLVTADGQNFVLSSNQHSFKDENGNVVEKANLLTRSYNYSRNVNNPAAFDKRSFNFPVLMNGTKVTANPDTGVIEINTTNASLHNSALSASKTNVNATNNVCIGDLGLGNVKNSDGTIASYAKLEVNGDLNVNAPAYANVQNVKVNDGDATVKSTRVFVNKSEFNGNLTTVDTVADYDYATANSTITPNDLNYTEITNVTVKDKLSVNQASAFPTRTNSDPVSMKNVTAGSADIRGYNADLKAVNFGNTNIETFGFTEIGSNSKIDGNLNIKTTPDIDDIGVVRIGVQGRSGSVRGQLDPDETLDVTGDLTIDAGSTIGFAAKVNVGGKADLTSRHSSVVIAESDATDYELNAADGVSVNCPLSVNRIVPLSGEVGGATWQLNENHESGEITCSTYFVETLRDYRITDPDPDPEPKPDPKPDPKDPKVPVDEPEKNINNLVLNGIDTSAAQTFTPIAFAADEEPDVVKRIAKIVFKTPDGVVSISDRLIQKDIDGSN